MSQNTRPAGLSKSRFCYGLQCEKQLWWRVHEPDAPELVALPGLQVVLDRGTRVGELARQRFPGGVLVEGEGWTFARKLERTRQAVASGAPAVFEAAFAVQGVYVAVDVMERQGTSWTLTEVKSALDVKEPHIPDVAVQLHVVRSAGLDVKRAELMHLDRACTFPDLSNLFVREDVTAQAEALLPETPGRIRRLQEMLAGELPLVARGPHCAEPYECPFIARCWPSRPPHHVSTLYRIGSRAEELEAEGYAVIDDLPDDLQLSETAARQVRSVKSRKIVAEPSLGAALKAFGFPIAFLDFETINPAVPAWNGCHPYEVVPVQISCHILAEAGALVHHQHIADRGGDPRPAMADAVVAACRGTRTVLAYNATFERRCLEHLAAAVPGQAGGLRALAARLQDLLPVVRDNVYHPDFGGGFGLKTVAAAVVPELAYSALQIADGGTASFFLEGLLLGDIEAPAEVREKLRAQLLEYCGRDTLVMVRLLERLRELATSSTG